MSGLKNAETASIRAYIDTKITADIKTTVASPGLDTKVISEKASVAYFLPIKTMVTGNVPKADASDHLIDSGIAFDEIMVEPAAAVAGNFGKFTAGKQLEDTGIAATDFTKLQTWAKNHVVSGGKGADGSTASVHDEAVPSHDFNTDISECVAIVNNIMGTLAAVNDGDLTHDAAADPIGAVNDTLFCTAVIKEAAGALSYQYVEGTAAPAVSAVTPTDGEITTAVGHARWIRVCDYKFTRTGAATLTLTLYNDVKPVVAA